MYTRRSAVAALGGLALAAAGCRNRPEAQQPLIVGAAANLTEVAPLLGKGFQSDTGIPVTFSFASTAQLANQIENGAPFDLFLAADAEHVDQLNQKHLLVSGSDAPYAQGVLALWLPDADVPVERIEDLVLPEIRTIALAKPELAPYGAASVDALKRCNIWDRVRNKIVYAENISMAKQFGSSKNADAVFTADSLVLHETGRVIQVDASLYPPIVQKLGIPASSRRQADASKLAGWIIRGNGHKILASFGYR